VRRSTKQEIVYAAMIVFFCSMWVIGEGARKGSDDRATEAIEAGNHSYRRWVVSVWEPSPRMEKALFAVQGACGCLLGGYCLYRLSGRGKKQS
jgi:cobalt transport protein